MHYIIYLTTNKINNKKYIGSRVTKNLEDGYLGSGLILKKAIDKYGKDSFERRILNYCSSREEMYTLEYMWVDEEVVEDEDYYNLRIGGKGGFTIEEASEGRKAADLVLEQKYGKNFIKVISQKAVESRKNISSEDRSKIAIKANKTFKEKNGRYVFEGCSHTEETKRIIGAKSSAANKGTGNPMYGKTRITNGYTNSTIDSEEQIPLGWYRGITHKNKQKHGPIAQLAELSPD